MAMSSAVCLLLDLLYILSACGLVVLLSASGLVSVQYASAQMGAFSPCVHCSPECCPPVIDGEGPSGYQQ